MASQPGKGYLVGDRYRLAEPVGRGGFGTVWRATDTRLDVTVALKELRLDPLLEPGEREYRLASAAREARNAVRLRHHPNIVSVLDIVDDNGMPWIVMEFVTGTTLESQLRKHGALSDKGAIRVAMGLLAALKAAHSAGIVHRDIKPANVMLAEGGGVVLADFGISIDQTSATLTSAGAVIGTLEYLAPERIEGKKATPESDLFSLGATLHQARSGSSPFSRGSTAATLNAVLKEDPRPELDGSTPLYSLLRLLLSKTPEARPTAQQALDMLKAAKPASSAPGENPVRTNTSNAAPLKDEGSGGYCCMSIMMFMFVIFTCSLFWVNYHAGRPIAEVKAGGCVVKHENGGWTSGKCGLTWWDTIVTNSDEKPGPFAYRVVNRLPGKTPQLHNRVCDDVGSTTGISVGWDAHGDDPAFVLCVEPK